MGMLSRLLRAKAELACLDYLTDMQREELANLDYWIQLFLCKGNVTRDPLLTPEQRKIQADMVRAILAIEVAETGGVTVKDLDGTLKLVAVKGIPGC